MTLALAAVALAAVIQAPPSTRPFEDRTHESKVLGEPRSYRIILPPGYAGQAKRYPVLYFFHGHSDRYTLEHYDGGKDFIPKMVDYVAQHDLIVVLPDGYVARDYTGFYGGTPYDVRAEGGAYDFGAYFKELVEQIDGTFRTLTDRRHRGISGLSMGGFMSLWLSARYPDLLGSASAFNPGHEFYAGEAGRRILWRSKDHVANHAQSMIRLVRASGDYISQYHEELRGEYARADAVDFEYRIDEYHRHWITSIAETFDFHRRAFDNPALDNVPVSWSHASPYRRFGVWGCEVEVQADSPALTYLEDVRQGGLRIRTRQWAPDGPPAAGSRITLRTAPVYKAKTKYILLDYPLAGGKTARSEVESDASGRLAVTVDGTGHQLSFAGPGTGAQPPILLPLTGSDRLRVMPAREVALPIRIYNPRAEPMTELKVALTSEYPTVRLAAESASVPAIPPGEFVDLAKSFRALFTAGDGTFEPTRLQLSITFDGWYGATYPIDLLVAPEQMPKPAVVEILDGRTRTFTVFRQKGNQGGGAPVEMKVTEGKGNGNGILEPGEEATVWVKVIQGMDPFDKNNWHRCKIYSDSPWLTEVADLQNPKQREWTSAQERTSVVRLARETPSGTTVSVILSNETWSFRWTPDARYGREKLYQAFQLHREHLHALDITVRK